MALKLSMRTFIAGAVAAVWIVTALASVITTNYTSLGAVTPVMMIVVGFLFGSRPSSNGNSQRSTNNKEEK
jgi:ATP/ADP translocase